MKNYLKVFAIALFTFAIGVGVSLIPTKGIWIYYGDFNVQQIPFYMHLHDLIRSGNFSYDWCTDIGGSVVGCYSFYILGSPFFWLTIPFKTEMIPYLIPWINALKYAVMAVTAFAYMKRHTKTEWAAAMGSLLFAFSGYSGAVLCFNHFHDVVAFFPLYLITLEKCVEEKKRIGFMLMTTLMAIINYYFFVGEVVFLIIYFVCRYWIGNKFKDVYENMLRVMFAGVVGTLLAGFYLLPAIYYTANNSRVSNVLSGNSFVAYDEPTMWLGIIKNVVMIPDVSGLNSMFNQGFSRVSGVAGYLPLFSVSCVIAWFIYKGKEKHWTKRVLATCLVCAMVPGLNAVFSAMNNEYYARWYFMPILMMALVSVKFLEEMTPDSLPILKKGVVWVLAISVAIMLFALLPAKDSDGNKTILAMLKNPELLFAEFVFTLLMSVSLIVLVFRILPKRISKTALTVMITSACVLTSAMMVLTGAVLIEKERKLAFIEQGLYARTI